jgi:hypothetical protein
MTRHSWRFSHINFHKNAYVWAFCCLNKKGNWHFLKQNFYSSVLDKQKNIQVTKKEELCFLLIYETQTRTREQFKENWQHDYFLDDCLSHQQDYFRHASRGYEKSQKICFFFYFLSTFRWIQRCLHNLKGPTYFVWWTL